MDEASSRNVMPLLPGAQTPSTDLLPDLDDIKFSRDW
jgi:hypothetical protein